MQGIVSSTPSIAGQNPDPSYWLPYQGHEHYICKNFGINHDFTARVALHAYTILSSSLVVTKELEGIGLWARDNNDHLGSGRLLYDTEPTLLEVHWFIFDD